MTDLQKLFEEVDTLTAEEIKELYAYIQKNHIEFVPAKTEQESLKRRVLGLHAHLGPHWMSEDFDDELPDEFWLGEE
jgi:hypothetical protein